MRDTDWLRDVFWLVAWVESISEPFECVSWDIRLTNEAVFSVLEHWSLRRDPLA